MRQANPTRSKLLRAPLGLILLLFLGAIVTPTFADPPPESSNTESRSDESEEAPGEEGGEVEEGEEDEGEEEGEDEGSRSLEPQNPQNNQSCNSNSDCGNPLVCCSIGGTNLCVAPDSCPG